MSASAVKSATKLKPKKPFDYSKYSWKSDIDYRANPEKYKVGKGEQGVLLCEPYKGEIGQYWRFKTPEIAKESSDTIMKLFVKYLKEDDFIGADMSRKYLQMGFTRARRFTNWKGGRKYKNEEKTETFERGSGDPIKAESAQIFFDKWKQAEANKKYKKMKEEWKNKYG